MAGGVAPSTGWGPSWYTPADVAQVAPWGWAPLNEEYEVAILVDPRFYTSGGHPLFARLTYAGALDAAARLGAGLILPQQVAEQQQRARVAVPGVYLPDDAIRSSARGALAHRAGETPAEWDQRLRNAGMTSEPWALHHDEVFWERLGSWEPGELVAGAGKHWVAGAPPGRAWLAGWWNGSSFIQPIPNPSDRGFHDSGHHDYGTTTIVVRRRDGQPLPANWGHGAAPAGPPATVPTSAVSSGALGVGLALAGIVGGAALLAWHLTTRGHGARVQARAIL